MNYYDILGIDEGASKEEIQKAYESRLNKIKAEVTNERRIKLFTGALNEAYEALMREKNDKQDINSSLCDDYEDEFKTVVMDSKEIQSELKKQQIVYAERESNATKKKSKSRSSSSSSKNRNNKASSSDKDKYRYNENDEKDKENRKSKNEKNKVEKVTVKSENSLVKSIFNVLMLPLKVIALPIIAVLSIIIFACKTINLVSWIASKVIIVVGIGSGAIHLYQIHLGQATDKKFLVLAGVAIVISFFLPYVLRIIPKTLGILNDMLKEFVFN